jgi:hypothetical protein
VFTYTLVTRVTGTSSLSLLIKIDNKFKIVPPVKKKATADITIREKKGADTLFFPQLVALLYGRVIEPRANIMRPALVQSCAGVLWRGDFLDSDFDHGNLSVRFAAGYIVNER